MFLAAGDASPGARALPRLSILALASALASCAAPGDSAVSGATPAPFWAQHPLSEYNAAFAGKPFDYRCGDCDFEGVAGCPALQRADRVVRITGVSQQLIDTDCFDNNGHELVASCTAHVVLRFEQIDTEYSTPLSDPVSSVAANFSYQTGPDRSVPAFLDPRKPYHVFLLRNTNAIPAPAEWRALAICPRHLSGE